MADGSKVSVGIVSYRTRELLRACLTELADHPGPVAVVDNASDDGSADMVRQDFPDVALDASDRNLGYGAGANRLMRSATTPYLLLLNADARPSPGAIAALEATLDANPSAAVVGPRLHDAGGRLQRSCRQFPTPASFFVDQAGLRPVVDRLGLGDRHRRFDHRGDRVVPWVLGAVMAMRLDAVRAVGCFDDGYFLYFEEIDLSRRLAEAGWETRFDADATFHHVGGASSGDRSATTARYFYRSGARYFAVHGPDGSRYWYRPLALLAIGAAWIGALVRHRRNDGAFLRAVAADRANWRPSEPEGR